MSNFQFEIIKKSTAAPLARVGIIQTPHGKIETPAFIPVGTKATIKSILIEDFEKYVGAQSLLANTYHLYLEPGEKIIKEHGGFAKMMNYNRPTWTDSGGFQVFSLGTAMGVGVSKIAKREDLTNDNLEKNFESKNFRLKDFIIKNKYLGIEIGICLLVGFIVRISSVDMNLLLNSVIMGTTFLIIDNLFFKALRQKQNKELKPKSLVKISEDGVEFRSILDGSKHFFTPEKSMSIQHDLGADIFFAFDECTSPLANYDYQAEALNRTHRWAKRSLREHLRLGNSSATNLPQALYAVVQGGKFDELRKESAKVLAEMEIEGRGFDGFGIGGSFTKEDMAKTVKIATENLPENKPRHLLGIGEVEDLFLGIEYGIDTFDCVTPTRIARNGAIYTKSGKINLFNAKYKHDYSPVCDDTTCYSNKYTKSYLAHLFRSHEMIASTIASLHNLHFIVHLVKDIRQSIIEDRFMEFKKEFLKNYKK